MHDPDPRAGDTPAESRGDFARRVVCDRHGQPWTTRDYQLASLNDFSQRKVHCDGRDVGKTTEIEIVALWAAAARANTEMLIAAQTENHLFPLMHRIVRRFQTTPLLAHGIAEIKRSPSWMVRFANGFILWGRIAGPRGVNFQGMHVDWQIVDEAQEMTEAAWAEILQALNGGGRRWVYGVPNGLRNTYYRMTQDRAIRQYRWPSALNPEFTAAKDAELAALYGGRTSPAYIHRVLGEHGAPAHGVFALDDYLACVDEGADFVNLVLNDADCTEDAPFDAPPAGTYYLGCDLGYARDPSEFAVYRAENAALVNTARIRLENVRYTRQAALIKALDRAYVFRVVAIDAGNAGRAVAHQLMNEDTAWCERVLAVDFGGTLELPELPDGSPQRRRAKEFMTELLVRRMADRSIRFPNLPDRESQYAGHTYRIGPMGRVAYDKGNDHLIDADRCAVLAHFHDTREPGPAAFLRPPIIRPF